MAKFLRKAFNKGKRKLSKSKKEEEGESDGPNHYEQLHLYETGDEGCSYQDYQENKYENVDYRSSHEDKSKDGHRYLLVAAIDLGTSASGYAFSFRNDFKTNPLQISTHIWTASTTVLRSSKTPTCILFNPQKEFDSFGFEAQNKYSALIGNEVENSGDWYFFESFKMSLYENKELSINTEIRAKNSKPMAAINVFSESLKFLKNHLMKRCFNMTVGLKDEDILWTLTVPAIWNDNAKLFMRRAAEMAGISRSQLLLALEPEAGAIFCKHIPIEVERKDDNYSIHTFEPGSCYMVVDAGGGTVDITIHKVVSKNQIQEVHAATGGPWGGNFVNKEYFQFLESVFGKKTFKEFCHECVDDYIDLVREFEVKKQNTKLEEPRVTMRIPLNLIHMFEKYNKDNDISTYIQSLPNYKDCVEVKKDKLIISQEVFVNFFNATTNAIVDHLEKITKENENISSILMIGGFSDSIILQNKIYERFRSKHVIIPEDASLCVLKGAVIFGHDQEVVASRILRCTYGIECSNDFIEGVHDPSKKYISTNTGIEKCKDVFGIIAKMGDSVPREQASKERYLLVDEPNIETAKIAIYVSTISSTPRYTTENGCRKIGYVSIPLQGNKENTQRRIYFSLIFGETEVKVLYRQENYWKCNEKLLDLLGETTTK